MNQKAAKNERRQIRRVIGDDASTLVRGLCGRVSMIEDAWVAERLSRHQLNESHNALCARVEAIEKAQHRGLWGRLKWLLRGC